MGPVDRIIRRFRQLGKDGGLCALSELRWRIYLGRKPCMGQAAFCEPCSANLEVLGVWALCCLILSL